VLPRKTDWKPREDSGGFRARAVVKKKVQIRVEKRDVFIMVVVSAYTVTLGLVLSPSFLREESQSLLFGLAPDLHLSYILWIIYLVPVICYTAQRSGSLNNIALQARGC
jgi:hypothetical protein